MTKQRKTRSDTIAGQVKRFEEKERVDIPEGVILRTNEQKQLWEHYTSAREPESWRTIDLLNVWEMVKYMIIIRQLHKAIEKDGVMIEGQYGPVQNEAVKMLIQIKRLHIAIASSMSLGIRGNDAVALNAGGKSAIDQQVEKEREAQMSLLAH